MPSNAEKLQALCDETLTGFDSTIPYAYNGRPQFGTFQQPLEVVRHAPELHFDDPHLRSSWMAVPAVAKLNRKRLKVRHHVVDDPHFIAPKKNRPTVPPSRGVKLRDVNTILKEQEETKGMSEDQLRRYRESKRQLSPQRRPQQHHQQATSKQQRAVDPVQDILNEITAASVPRSTPPGSNHINNNNNNNNNNPKNNSSSQQRKRGALGHKTTSSDSSSSSNSTPSRSSSNNNSHPHPHPHHNNNTNVNSRAVSSNTTTTTTATAKKPSSKAVQPPSTTSAANTNNKKRKLHMVPDLLVAKAHLLDPDDVVETRKIAGLKRMASRDIHERQDNVVTKRPRLLLHLKLQQIVDEGKKKKKIREKTKTSKASSKTADANFVPSIKQSSSSSTTTTAATAATAEAATTTTIPRKSKLEAKVSPKPAANGTSAKHTEPKKSATTNKADMVKDISEKRSSSKLDSATPAPASTAEITNNHSNNSKQMQRHQEDSPKTKDPTLATTTTTTTTTATPTNTTTTTTDNPSATRSTSSTADFLKSTRIPKRKQLPQDKVAHMDRELEEGETISPSPSPSREIPAPVLKAPETTTPSAAAAAVTKPSPLSEDNNRDRYDRSSPSLKDRSSHGRAASKDEDRVSSSKRTSRRSDDDTEWRRTERRDSNNRLRTDDDDKKRRSDDRARDDRSVDDRKLHRRDSRQSSITSSDRHRRRSRSPPSTIKTTSSSTSTTARAHKHPRSRSPRPAASRSRSPRARSRSSTRRSSPERERERRTSSSSSTSTLIREPEAKAPAPVYKNATSPDSETEQQCKMYALMFRKLATAYKHRGDPRQKDITGLIDHMQAVLNYVLSFYYQDKKTDEYQGLRHWESLYPFASIVMRHLQSKREMQLYSVCAHVMGMVRYYTFRRREMVANKKLDPLICEKNPQEAPPVKAAVAHDAAKATRQALTDFEDAYKFFKDAEKHMDQEQFREQFPQTHQMACEKGEYGPGIVIGGEAGISIEPRYPFVPFAKLHHAAIVAKVVLHEYLQKHNLVYTPISDTDEFM